MSGGLAPSKSTVYLSNLPFSLTNNDLHKILEKYGQVVKVTIMKDKKTRKSKGVAFVLYLERESAYKCVQAINRTEMFGRTLRCSIAVDNGRAPEFIRRKVYKDKTSCYECGETGHLSYDCPKNLLGDREPPKKKEKKRHDDDEDGEEDGESDEGGNPAADSLAAAIKFQQAKEVEEMRASVGTLNAYSTEESNEPKRKKYKKDEYFSDEEELEN